MISNKITQSLAAAINVAVSSNDSAAYKVATEVHNAYRTVNWRFTNYKSFSKFIETETTLTTSSAHRYMFDYRAVIKFTYTAKQVASGIQALGYYRLVAVLRLQATKVPMKVLITKYKGINVTALNSQKSDPTSNDRAYAFSLPKDYADKLDAALNNYSMVAPPKGNRHGVRAAMMGLIDTI